MARRESLRADVEGEKMPKGKKKMKMQGDNIRTGIRGSKKQEENGAEDQGTGQGGCQGRKEKRGRSGSESRGRIEKEREGPRRAGEGRDHSFSLWVA